MNQTDSYDSFYKSICRLCLKLNKSDNMIALFNEGKINSYGKSVIAFSNIKLTEKDSLPSSMCKKCLILLKQCIQFKFTCENSERQLLKIRNLSSDDRFKERLVEYTIFSNNLANLNCDTRSKCVTQNNLFDNLKKSDSKVQESKMSDEEYNFFNNVQNNSLDRSISVQELNIDLNLNESNTVKTSSDIDSMEYLTKTPRRRLRTVLRRRMKYVIKEKQKLKVRKYICKICNKELANQSTYENHMQRHNGCRFICEHCGKGFPVMAELKMHLVARHGTGPYLQCPHCPFKAPRKFDLIEHERIHSGERPFTCDKCGLTFRRRGIWKKHLIHHSEKTIQCMSCPKKFYQKGHMLSHYNNVHERMYMYVCGKCGALYAKPITVRRHLIDRHGIPREMQGKILRVKRSSGFQK